jgi:hypothetical protein
MHSAVYYRNRASTARQLARTVADERAAEILTQTAQDYEEIVEDLETGALRSATRT